ncbi:MAG: cytochrome b/b6 domain-containing protein, partial [Anaerolineales bacterium]
MSETPSAPAAPAADDPARTEATADRAELESSAPRAVETAAELSLPEPAPEPAPEPPAAPEPRPLVKRHHGIVRATHWLNAVLLLGMIASGLQIYGAFPRFGPRGGPFLPNPWQNEMFPRAVRLGGWLAGGINWHFALAWPFVLTGLVYLGYLALAGEWRSLLFRPRDVPRAWQMQLY